MAVLNVGGILPKIKMLNVHFKKDDVLKCNL